MRRLPLPPQALPPGPLEGQLVELPQDAARYARDVLRLTRGQRVQLFDGLGRVLIVELEQLQPGQVTARVLQDVARALHESPLKLTLCHAMPKGERWELVLEKTAELGVTEIIPLHTARGVVRVTADKLEHKLERWRKIALAASRQCQRDLAPQLRAPMTLAQALAATPPASPLTLHLVGMAAASPQDPLAQDPLAQDPLTQDPLTQDAGAQPSHVILWVGPEGGFDPQETAALLERARQITLGPRVLRSETAAITLVALAQHWYGDLR